MGAHRMIVRLFTRAMMRPTRYASFRRATWHHAELCRNVPRGTLGRSIQRPLTNRQRTDTVADTV